MNHKYLAALATTALLGSVFAGAPAGAEDATTSKATVLARGLLSPLSLAVADDGAVYYSENFKGTLLTKSPGRKARTLFQAKPGTEVGAVSEQDGRLRFATTLPNGRGAYLKGVSRNGQVRTLADLGGYEKRSNPDKGVRYGFRRLPADCDVPKGFPFRYTGIVESHPYATELSGRTTYVADAAGNAVLKVDPRGRMSTVAVLPPVRVKVTEALAAALELPACTEGGTYFLEPVPTDVEKGPGGDLYVSTLPGGPEDGSAGSHAAVYRVDPSTGRTVRVASGLANVTGVEVARNGDVYVAELFGGRIARVRKGASRATTVYSAPLVGDVELRHGLIYVTSHVLTGLSGEEGDAPSGRVVRLRR